MSKGERKVLVCRAKQVCTGDCAVFRNNKYFYVNDGRTGCFTKRDLNDLAYDLHFGIGFSAPVKSEDIIYKPEKTAQIYYVDGYFGRPAIPAAVHIFSPLSRKEIKKLKQILSKFEKGT